MKKFKATNYEENKIIELADSNELEDLFETINKSEDFILEWTDGAAVYSEIIISCDMIGQIKAGDMKLTSKEVKK